MRYVLYELLINSIDVNKIMYCKFKVCLWQLGISIMFSLTTLVYINEYKAQSKCNQDLDYNLTGLCIHLYKPE